jgi:hypothetical protein
MNLLEVGDKQAQPIALPVDSSRAIMQQYAVMLRMQYKKSAAKVSVM